MKPSLIVCVFGISGVGKTSTIRRAYADQDDVLHLQGSSLIKQGLADASISPENLRRSDGCRVNDNQALLIEMFRGAITTTPSRMIVFDGHALIDTDTALIEIPAVVIKALHPTMVVHVEDDPLMIVLRRQEDPGRARPVRSAEVLADHQSRSRRICGSYSRELSVPMHVVQSGDLEEMRAACQSMLSNMQIVNERFTSRRAKYR